jgi:hypothetical protein
MIEIAGLTVEESYVEYAVDSPWAPESMTEVDSLAEARALADKWDGKVLTRHIYVTQWDEA